MVRKVTVARVAELLEVVAEVYEVSEPHEARRQLARGLNRVLRAQATVVAMVQDFVEGGAAALSEIVCEGFPDALAEHRYLDGYAVAANDPAVAEMSRFSGSPSGSFRRRDLLDDRSWYDSEFVHEILLKNGVDDQMYGFRHVAGNTVVGLGISKAPDDTFTEEDRDLLGLFSAQSALWFGVAPEGGIRELARLSRRERETLDALLVGASEKEAATRLGISVHTLHVYVKKLYRKLNVGSRGELMSLFVSRRKGL